MRKIAVQLLLLVFLSSWAASAISLQATTTLAAETGNNTSAADSFTTQSNGNIAGANVSDVPLRALLYPGAATKIYTQFLPWFGFGDHINVGYVSNDPAQVQRQVKDMVGRGIDGAIIDWYGRGTLNSHFVSYDQASQDLMHEAELHSGFTFAIQHDAVALKNCGCDVTQMLIADLNYAVRTYIGSPAYLHYNGQPVFFFFGHESYPIDWNLVRSSVSGNPLFIFRNGVGFSYAQSNGAFSWVQPTNPVTTGLAYLDSYYSTALTYSSADSIGSAYKGFNDSLAAWGSGRLIPQQCGQTFLQSIAEADKYYSVSNQMLGIQMVTWNDYEEGTELETGIDNCVTVSASASGSIVSWNISGQMNTIDHFSVFASQDGQNLMWLADESTNVSSLDLAQFSLPAGSYVAYVKAVGKPMMTNKMSAAATLAIAGPTPPPTADFTLSTPSGDTATIQAGQTAIFALQLAASGTPLSVSITCTGAPASATCAGPASATTVNPGTPDTINLSVSTVGHGSTVPAFLSLAPPSGWLILALLSGALITHKRRIIPNHFRRTLNPLSVTFLMVLATTLAAGCGGASSRPNASPAPTPGGPSTPVASPTPTPTATPTTTGTPAGTYTLMVTANSGSVTHAVSLTLTVQ